MNLSLDLVENEDFELAELKVCLIEFLIEFFNPNIT
jgi:hypothetical protein